MAPAGKPTLLIVFCVGLGYLVICSNARDSGQSRPWPFLAPQQVSEADFRSRQ